MANTVIGFVLFISLQQLYLSYTVEPSKVYIQLYTVEPSKVYIQLYTVEPSKVYIQLYTVEPSKLGTVGSSNSVHYSEVSLIEEFSFLFLKCMNN